MRGALTVASLALLLDLPSQALDETEMKRAKALFTELGAQLDVERSKD